MSAEEMTRTERNDLAGLTRKRAKVAKDAARQRAAELTAAAEEQLSAVFTAQDERWGVALAAARLQVEKANEQIRDVLGGEGVPDEFMPSVSFGWAQRGANAEASRRTEMRSLARTRIDAQLKAAFAAIEASSVDVQTQLLAGGLTSDGARAFLESMPTADELLPAAIVVDLAIEAS